MQFKFEKYHGLGNDFVFISSRYLAKFKTVFSIKEFVINVCDRQFGIGADGVVFIKKSKKIQILILNSDGSVAGTCGNALRCLGLKLWRENVWNGQSELPIFRLPFIDNLYFDLPDSLNQSFFDRPFSSLSKIHTVKNKIVDKKKLYSQNVSVFFDRPKEIFFYENFNLTEICKKFFKTASNALDVVFVQLENPHLVFYATEFEHFTHDQCIEFGKYIQQHLNVNIGMLCPRHLRVNVTSYVDEPKENRTFFLRVYERGAGLTLACGSGAIAAASALKFMGCCSHDENLEHTFQMQMPGGLMTIDFSSFNEKKLVLSAMANFIFTGLFYH